MSETCKHCWWWKNWESDGNRGDCRKSPPVVVSRENGEYGSVWPDTKRDDFCGEWKDTK